MDINKDLLIGALRRIYETKGADVFVKQTLLVSMLKDTLLKAGNGDDELVFFRKIIEGTPIGYQILEGLNTPAEIQRILPLISKSLKGKPLYQNDDVVKFTLEILCEAFSWPLSIGDDDNISPTGEYLNPKLDFIKRLDTSKPIKIRLAKWDDEFFDTLNKFSELELIVDSLSALAKISDLTNMTSLTISEFNGDFDFVRLAKLTKLKHLSISAKSEYINSYSESKNISALGTLASLTKLDIRHIHMPDLSAVAKLHNLKELLLNVCGITAIDTIKTLTSLESIDFEWNEISDFSCISALPRLCEAELSNNKISSTSGLPNKSATLERLYLKNNKLNSSDLYSGYGDSKKSVFSHTNFPKLNYLNLQGNGIDDWKDCAEISEVGGRDFVVFGGDRYDTNTSALTLSDGKLRNYNTNALKHLTELTELTICHDSISDLSFVTALKKLKRLDITDNEVEDLTPLNALAESSLEYLNVTDNSIRVLGKARKVAAVVGLPTTGKLFQRKLKKRLLTFDDDIVTLPNAIGFVGFVLTAIYFITAIVSIFTVNPLNIDAAATAVSNNPMHWYNWCALVGLGGFGAGLIIYSVWSFFEDLSCWCELPRTIISFVVAIGCAAGFFFGGLSPLVNVRYNEISIFNTYNIAKSTTESNLSIEDIANVEEYVFDNIDDIGFIRNITQTNSFYTESMYKTYVIIAFVILCILGLGLLVYLIMSIFKKSRGESITCAILVVPVVVSIFCILNPNTLRHQINLISQQLVGRASVKELQIDSNELFYSPGNGKSTGYWSKPDGTLYTGEFVSDTITGNGKYTNSDRITYEGTFVFGKLYGNVKVFAPNGVLIYEGEFSNGDPKTAIFDIANELISSEDYETCYKIASSLAECKVPRGLNFLGTMYQAGEFIEQDLEKAFNLFTEAAELGESRGNVNLGWMYFNGQYVEEDEAKGVELWKKSADQGLSWGQYYYAWANYHGYGTEKNINEALKYYKKASSEEETAMYELGLIYVYGLGTKNKTDEGIDFLTQASEKGNESATAFIKAYKANIALIDAFNKGAKKTEATKQLVAYEKLHFSMQTAQTTLQNIDDAANNLIDMTIGTLDSSVSRTAEYLLIQSLLEYLLNEAPPDEQNLFMLLECLSAGTGEDYIASNLDRLMNFLRDKNPEHIALGYYDEYKALTGSFAYNDVILSCLQRLDEINVILSPWNSESECAEIFISDENSIPVLSRIILLSFGTETEQGYQLDMEAFLQNVQKDNISENAPIQLSELASYNPSENIKSTVNSLVEFYSDFSSNEEGNQ